MYNAAQNNNNKENNMNFNTKSMHRRTIRLQEYDYSQTGMYFVTICTYQKNCFFGEISNETMQLNEIGKAAELCWRSIPEHYKNIEMDEFVIMPNHLHGIISIVDSSNKKHTLGTIIRSYKASVTHWVRKNTDIRILWQHNYYEHIVRNERDYQRIWEYIATNPLKWHDDALHPKNNIKDPLLFENP
jgi:REP element-mobilizing transposase RayT